MSPISSSVRATRPAAATAAAAALFLLLIRCRPAPVRRSINTSRTYCVCEFVISPLICPLINLIKNRYLTCADEEDKYLSIDFWNQFRFNATLIDSLYEGLRRRFPSSRPGARCRLRPETHFPYIDQSVGCFLIYCSVPRPLGSGLELLNEFIDFVCAHRQNEFNSTLITLGWAGWDDRGWARGGHAVQERVTTVVLNVNIIIYVEMFQEQML